MSCPTAESLSSLCKAKILLIGFGKMGKSLCDGWQRNFSITVIDPYQSQQPEGIDFFNDPTSLERDYKPDAIVIAVKPQSFAEVLPQYKKFAQNTSLFISIAAGKTVVSIEKLLGVSTPIVRAMPNLAALIQQSMTVAFANSSCTREQKNLAEKALSVIGHFGWVNDENDLDTVTAVSGSGPAYFFLMTEILAACAIKNGLSPDLGTQLARQTLIGAAHVVARSTESITHLREAVTSKGGTTEAALAIFNQNDDFLTLCNEAVNAAIKRSQTLAHEGKQE